MVTRRTMMAGLGTLAAAPTWPGRGLRAEARPEAAMDAAIEAAIGEGRVVGAVVLVARRGEPAYARAAGYADREAGRPMELGTPFRLASVTKPFATAAAARLVEAGALDPSRPVTDWLPAFRPALADGTVPVITVDHLMPHMAGLDYGFQQPEGGNYARAGVSDGLDAAPVSLAENLRRIASVPLERGPGASWRYSVATDVLGAVIERASGMGLPDAIRALVTGPLGIEGAGFHSTDPDLAVPYTDAQPRPERMDGPTSFGLPPFMGSAIAFDPGRIADPHAFPSGGAGMAARAQDVLVLLEALRTGPFLSQATRDQLWLPRIGAEAQTQGPGWGFSWLGSLLLDPAAAGSPLSRGSVAWGGVYGHSWCIDVERELTVVALTNTTLEGMVGRFPREVIAAATQAA